MAVDIKEYSTSSLYKERLQVVLENNNLLKYLEDIEKNIIQPLVSGDIADDQILELLSEITLKAEDTLFLPAGQIRNEVFKDYDDVLKSMRDEYYTKKEKFLLDFDLYQLVKGFLETVGMVNFDDKQTKILRDLVIQFIFEEKDEKDLRDVFLKPDKVGGLQATEEQAKQLMELIESFMKKAHYYKAQDRLESLLLVTLTRNNEDISTLLPTHYAVATKVSEDVSTEEDALEATETNSSLENNSLEKTVKDIHKELGLDE